MIPANSMNAGKGYRQEAGGVLGTSSAAPTWLWTPRIGQSATPSSNITCGASTAITSTASLAAVPWNGYFQFVVRSLGLAASGAATTGTGQIVIGNLTTASATAVAFGGTVTSTVDNTAATGIIFSITWGTSQANNTATGQNIFPVQSLN